MVTLQRPCDSEKQKETKEGTYKETQKQFLKKKKKKKKLFHENNAEYFSERSVDSNL
ncbi:hypothetical protein HanIR_Chr13g0670471 [Helianthus annuus]|nr:hypothetical protein HanIR_Chr13g0670471 [Helianthus annuus]